jgi:hypothetical protein
MGDGPDEETCGAVGIVPILFPISSSLLQQPFSFRFSTSQKSKLVHSHNKWQALPMRYSS